MTLYWMLSFKREGGREKGRKKGRKEKKGRMNGLRPNKGETQQ